MQFKSEDAFGPSVFSNTSSSHAAYTQKEEGKSACKPQSSQYIRDQSRGLAGGQPKVNIPEHLDV